MSDEKKHALRCIDPEMIDKGLEVCTTGATSCKECPYWIYKGNCISVLMKDTAALIYQLKNGGETPAAMEV